MTTPAKPDRWCCRAVELAATVLPPGQRHRYAMEFIAELYEMPRAQQVRHSIYVLASAWQLRAALAEAGTNTVQEDIMIVTARRPLRCRLRIHRWHVAYTEDGHAYEHCARCHRDRTEGYMVGFLWG